MNEELIVQFTEVDPKKHSVRFNCKDENPAVSSIYVNKSHLNKIGDAASLTQGIEIVIRPINRKD